MQINLNMNTLARFLKLDQLIKICRTLFIIYFLTFSWAFGINCDIVVSNMQSSTTFVINHNLTACCASISNLPGQKLNAFRNRMHETSVQTDCNGGYPYFQAEPTTKVFVTWFAPVTSFHSLSFGYLPQPCTHMKFIMTSCQGHSEKWWKDFSFTFKMADNR